MKEIIFDSPRISSLLIAATKQNLFSCKQWGEVKICFTTNVIALLGASS
jgi:hypothetical protein